jgi:toxin-antitoxin system PIN domain toxin
MSLAFPDVNVWLALASEEHTHRSAALGWWRPNDGPIAFCRISQMGLLRLLTTAAVMNNRPLSMREAWKVYDGFFGDERVEFLTEPPAVERTFRKYSFGAHASPKLWADAYLTAFASECGGSIVTFDRSLARRSGKCVVLQ